MKTIVLNIVWMIIIISIAALAYMQSTAFLKLKAYGDCSMASTYEAAGPNGARVSYPVQEVYKKCLKEKGY